MTVDRDLWITDVAVDKCLVAYPKTQLAGAESETRGC
jgi:hypothetical protein